LTSLKIFEIDYLLNNIKDIENIAKNMKAPKKRNRKQFEQG
jgi:hypothetical protein